MTLYTKCIIFIDDKSSKMSKWQENEFYGLTSHLHSIVQWHALILHFKKGSQTMPDYCFIFYYIHHTGNELHCQQLLYTGRNCIGSGNGVLTQLTFQVLIIRFPTVVLSKFKRYWPRETYLYNYAQYVCLKSNSTFIIHIGNVIRFSHFKQIHISKNSFSPIFRLQSFSKYKISSACYIMCIMYLRQVRILLIVGLEGS